MATKPPLPLPLPLPLMLMLMLMLAAAAEAALSGATEAFGSTTTAAVARDVEALLKPAISFSLDEDDTSEGNGESAVPAAWEAVAQRMLQYRQLECHETSVDVLSDMLDAAEANDRLAMAALGVNFLLGQECAPKRNLTWGVHWIRRAANEGQPDAQAMLAFLHDSDALRLVYNYTAESFEREQALPLYEAAAAAGSLYAQMALGHKHANGLGGFSESCPAAAAYYEQ
eukprot:5498229-Pleurochrysis_carterae.AAC.1